jgi:prepilin-type N-terminal cleavage/methylation domain-containing protein
MYEKLNSTQLNDKMRLKSGFTLVELAIVIVILGLLVGGVLAGQELIKQAKVRSVLSQLREYDTAINTFRAKYNNQIPGDFDKAHQYGIDKPQGSSTPNVAFTSCNNNDGNGNGIVSDSGAPSTPCDSAEPSSVAGGEFLNFWVHLSNAGLIKGSYSQSSLCQQGGWDNCNYIPGKGLPYSAIGNSMFVLTGISDRSLHYIIGYSSSNFDPSLNSPGLDSMYGGTLTPEEAYSLDAKLDDGIANKGATQSFVSYYEIQGWGYFTNDEQMGTTLDSTTCYNSAGQYNISNNNKICLIHIKSSG